MKKIILLSGIFILICAISVFGNGKKEEKSQSTIPQFRVAMEGTYPPYNYKDSSGTLMGFEVDLSKELGKRMNKEIIFVLQEWDGLIPGLLANKYDAIISTLSITDARKEKVDFSIPYRASTGRFVAPKEVGIEPFNADGTPNPSALEGKTIGVQRATTHANYIEAVFPDAKIVRYDQTVNLLLDFQAGRVDLVFHGPIKMAANFLDLPEGKDYKFIGLEIEDPKYFGIGVGVAIRKGNEELLNEINTALESVFADGTFEEINKKYWDFSVMPSVWYQ